MLPQDVYTVVSPSAARPDFNDSFGDSSGGQATTVPELTQAQMASHFSGIFEDTSYPANFDSFAWIFEAELGETIWSRLPSPPPGLANEIVAGPAQAATTQQCASIAPESQARATVVTPQIEILPRLTTRDRCGPDDAWPMEWHAVSDLGLTLPSLGAHDDDCSSVPESFYPTANTTEEARVRMLGGLQLPLERVPWQTVSLALPVTVKNDHCIDVFFRRYDRGRVDQSRGRMPEIDLFICVYSWRKDNLGHSSTHV
jgi:hypothetical protein